MDVGSKHNFRLNPVDTNTNRLTELLTKVQGIKDRHEAFSDRSLTSRHPRTYLSLVEVKDIRLGAMQTPAKRYTFSKTTTRNKEVVALEGNEHLNIVFENIVPEDWQVVSNGSKSYILHKVPAQAAEDGSPISSRRVAETMVEHSNLFSSQRTVVPVGFLETREECEIFLISEIPGAVASASGAAKPDIGRMAPSERTVLNRRTIDALGAISMAGLSCGGINQSGIQYNDGDVTLLNPLPIGNLSEDGVNAEWFELIATLRSLEGGSTSDAAKEARKAAAKYAYESNVVLRNAMNEKSKEMPESKEIGRAHV
jgi:hypothetical protein